MPDEFKLRLSANVMLRDDAGELQVFTPDGGRPPRWARDLIGDHAWGYAKAKRAPQALTDVTSPDGSPVDHLDVICDHGGNLRRPGLIARFERTFIETPSWSWTATLALHAAGNLSSTDPSNGNRIAATRRDWDQRRQVRTTASDGTERVQLWCPSCDLMRRGTWSWWCRYMDGKRATGATITRLSDLPANLG